MGLLILERGLQRLPYSQQSVLKKPQYICFLFEGASWQLCFQTLTWLVLASVSLYYFIIQQIFAEQYLSDRTTLGLRVLNRPLQIYLCATVLCFHSLSLPPFPLPKVPGIISIILSNTYLLKKKSSKTALHTVENEIPSLRPSLWMTAVVSFLVLSAGG